MNPRGIATAVVLLAGALAAPGAEPARYTVDDCVRIGLERSVAAANARRDERIADARVQQAGSTAYPHLGLESGYTRLDEVDAADFGQGPVEMGTLDNYRASASVSQLVYAGGKVSAALRAARLSRDYAAQARAESDAALVRDIRAGFARILLARESVSLTAQTATQLVAFVEQTERKYALGTASEFDLMSAKVRLANARPDLIRARNTHAVAVANLVRVLNIEATNEVEFVGALTCTPVVAGLVALQAAAASNRPALRMMEAGVRLKGEDVIAARSAGLPSVNTFFTYTGNNQWRFGTMTDEWQWHWSAGAGLTWNLWDGGLTRGSVAEKRLELEKARDSLEDFRRSIMLEVEQAWLDASHAAEAVASAGDNVALAEKALGIAGTRYGAGLATYLEFTDSTLALQAAGLSRAGALSDHVIAVARLQYACGLEDGAFARLALGNEPAAEAVPPAGTQPAADVTPGVEPEAVGEEAGNNGD